MLLLPFLHSVLIKHIRFSAKLDLGSELFSTEIHVIYSPLIRLAIEPKHIAISIYRILSVLCRS